MERRPLGTTGLAVSEIGFGCWQLGNGIDFEPMRDDVALELVEAALTAGINLFDTAPNYGAGRSEELLGRALEGRRDAVVLVSKFGHATSGRTDFSVDAFWKSLEGSLRRLRTDRLDVVLLHNPPAELYDGDAPLWKALRSAVEQGMLGHYGVSLDLADELEACLDRTDAEAVEVLFNILHQDVRRAFPALARRPMGVIAKVPLDSGWLSGRYDASTRFTGVRARWTPEQIAERAAGVERVADLVGGRDALLDSAFAFLLSYREVNSVIPGVRSAEQLRSALSAARGRLDGEKRTALEDLWREATEDGRRCLPW